MKTADSLFTKSTLLPSNHPVVLRRLVKELNANGWQAGRSFYFNGHKKNQARLHHGQLEVRFGSEPWGTAGFESFFGDGNGNQIAASRLAP